MWPILILAVGGYFYMNKGNKEKEAEARKQALAAKYQNKLPTATTKASAQLNVNPNLKNLIQNKIQQQKIKAMDEQIKADRYVETDEEKAEAKRQQEQKAKDNAARNAELVEANRLRQIERLKELQIKQQQINNTPKTEEQIKVETTMANNGITRDQYGRIVLPKPKK